MKTGNTPNEVGMVSLLKQTGLVPVMQALTTELKLCVLNCCIEHCGPDEFRVTDVRGAVVAVDRVGLICILLAPSSEGEAELAARVARLTGITESECQRMVNHLVEAEFIIVTDTPREIPFDIGQIIHRIDHPFDDYGVISISTVGVSVGGQCPYNCQGCYRKAQAFKQLRADVFTPVFEDARKLGCNYLALTGGEPTDDRLIDRTLLLARIAYDTGLRVYLNTAGYKLADCLPKLLPLICGVQVSLDGFAEFHNSYRRHPESFARAVAGIEACVDQGLPVMVNSVLTQANASHLKEFKDFLKELGVPRIRFSPIVPRGSACASPYLFDFSGNAMHSMIEARSEMYGSHFTFLTEKLICEAGLSMAYVREDGEVFPCAFLEHMNVGNISEASFLSMWRESEVFGKLRRGLDRDPLCVSCAENVNCIGNCVALQELRPNYCPRHAKARGPIAFCDGDGAEAGKRG